MGATLHRGARASHYRGLSCCGAQAPDAQAEQLWLTGLVAPRHVGSSQTRARTRVPCIGRQILNHCATREALNYFFNVYVCMYLFWLRWVLVAACGIFSCGMRTLSCSMHVGSSSPTRNRTQPPSLGAWSLTHWTTREVPIDGFLEGNKW